MVTTVEDPEKYWAPSEFCQVCGDASVVGSYLCHRCRHLMRRVETRKGSSSRGRRVDMHARLRALQRQWDQEIKAFRCHYTGIALADAHGSRRSATWEHVQPGDESSVVLVADVVNKMKGDLSEDAFRQLVLALAKHFEEPGFDEDAFPN